MSTTIGPSGGFDKALDDILGKKFDQSFDKFIKKQAQKEYTVPTNINVRLVDNIEKVLEEERKEIDAQIQHFKKTIQSNINSYTRHAGSLPQSVNRWMGRQSNQEDLRKSIAQESEAVYGRATHYKHDNLNAELKAAIEERTKLIRYLQAQDDQINNINYAGKTTKGQIAKAAAEEEEALNRKYLAIQRIYEIEQKYRKQLHANDRHALGVEQYQAGRQSIEQYRGQAAQHGVSAYEALLKSRVDSAQGMFTQLAPHLQAAESDAERGQILADFKQGVETANSLSKQALDGLSAVAKGIAQVQIPDEVIDTEAVNISTDEIQESMQATTATEQNTQAIKENIEAKQKLDSQEDELIADQSALKSAIDSATKELQDQGQELANTAQQYKKVGDAADEANSSILKQTKKSSRSGNGTGGGSGSGSTGKKELSDKQKYLALVSKETRELKNLLRLKVELANTSSTDKNTIKTYEKLIDFSEQRRTVLRAEGQALLANVDAEEQENLALQRKAKLQEASISYTQKLALISAKKEDKSINAANAELDKALKKQQRFGTVVKQQIDNYQMAADAIQELLSTQKLLGSPSIDTAKLNSEGIATFTHKVKTSSNEVQTWAFTWDAATGQIYQNTKRITTVGSRLEKFMDSLRGKFTALGTYLLSFASFYDIVNAFRSGITTIRELNTELGNMRKVADESLSVLQEYQLAAHDIAFELASTSKQVMSSTTDFLRLGYSLQEAASLAQDANIYANVGDMQIDEATEHMISSVQAWKSEFNSAVEASTALIDKYNEVGKQIIAQTYSNVWCYLIVA